ncbi:PorV/PorQ family protein [candidate division KSB1 bacterium]|nr:PorV/PorQ family protein [candidate division KSB1 bacterium]
MIRNEYNEVFDNGVSTGRAEIALDQGTFGAHDLAIGLTYSRQVTDQLQIGGNLRYVEEKLDDATAANWALDIGTVFHTGLKSFRIAMVGRNFGPDVNFAEYDERIQLEPASVKMPMSFNLGCAYDILENVDGNPHLWTVAAEFIHPNDGPEKVNIGTEYSFQDFLSLRGGYRFNYDEEGLTLGGGIKVKTSSLAVSFNYSYWAFGVLGDVNMFSIGLGL